MATWKDQPVLVTGEAGSIGSLLTEVFLDRGTDVVADNFSRGDFEKIAHLKDEIELKPVDPPTHKEWIEGTLNVDDIFHLAASVGGIHYIHRETVHGLTPSVLTNQDMLEAA